MWRFAYSGIRREEREVTSCSSPLDEARVAASRLISVGFCALLGCITWWLFPSWMAPYPVEGLGVYDMASVTHIGAGYSFILLGAAWGSYPGGRYWVPGSIKFYCQASLGRLMLKDSIMCHSFYRVDLSCVAIYECSSTRVFQFPVTVSFLVWSTVDNVSSKTTCYWG